MAFDLGIFKSSIMKRGIMKPNRFLVQLQAPAGLPDDVSTLIRDMEIWGESTSVPSFSLYTYQAKRYGYGTIENRPVFPVYTQWEVNFISDANGDIWKFFNNWLNLTVNSDMSKGIAATGTSIPFELSYKADYLIDAQLSIYRENKKDAPVKTVILRDAFPAVVGAIRLDWSARDAYSVVPVVFNFTDYFEYKPTSSPDGI